MMPALGTAGQLSAGSYIDVVCWTVVQLQRSGQPIPADASGNHFRGSRRTRSADVWTGDWSDG